MIWLIGAGPMAEEYAKVLLAMNLDMRVFGRSAASAETFTRKTGLPVTSGGLGQLAAVGRKHLPDAAIVAVSPDQLSETASFLLEHGVKSILIEKPGGLSYEDIRALCKQAKQARARLLIAYNRRFFASTLRAQEIIREDGGVTSFSFEITEWAHVIGKLNKDEDVLRSWFLANTTHVVDLAWHIGGFPTGDQLLSGRFAELAPCFQPLHRCRGKRVRFSILVPWRLAGTRQMVTRVLYAFAQAHFQADGRTARPEDRVRSYLPNRAERSSGPRVQTWNLSSDGKIPCKRYGRFLQYRRPDKGMAHI